MWRRRQQPREDPLQRAVRKLTDYQLNDWSEAIIGDLGHQLLQYRRGGDSDALRFAKQNADAAVAIVDEMLGRHEERFGVRK